MNNDNEHLAAAVLMVEPTSFGYDEQTAATNAFQHHPADPVETTKNALNEFHEYVAELRRHDIHVVVFKDSPEPPKPDAVFPNNWISTWPDGRVFVYPMATPVRRLERSAKVLDALKSDFEVTDIQDISATENDGTFLEGTGAIVFDRTNRIAYGCISPRCDENLFRMHVLELGFESMPFHAAGTDGTPIYHTNVMLGIQADTAVICGESINEERRRQVFHALKRTGHEIIDITYDQMNNFCANLLEVQNEKGEACIILSQAAYDAFTHEQREILSRNAVLIPVRIPTIEAVGGGSARCMLAEIYLPQKADLKQHEILGNAKQAQAI